MDFYNGSDLVYQGKCSIKYNGTDGAEKEFFPFLAYTKATDIRRPIKFIAARTAAEFKRLLADPVSNNLTGYIALVSQASVFRGAIAEWTGELGADGLLSYPDPRDGYNLDASLTYPNGRFLPANAPIVGVISDFNGDFLTPGLPAIDRKRDFIMDHMTTTC